MATETTDDLRRLDAEIAVRFDGWRYWAQSRRHHAPLRTNLVLLRDGGFAGRTTYPVMDVTDEVSAGNSQWVLENSVYPDVPEYTTDQNEARRIELFVTQGMRWKWRNAYEKHLQKIVTEAVRPPDAPLMEWPGLYHHITPERICRAALKTLDEQEKPDAGTVERGGSGGGAACAGSAARVGAQKRKRIARCEVGF